VIQTLPVSTPAQESATSTTISLRDGFWKVAKSVGDCAEIVGSSFEFN